MKRRDGHKCLACGTTNRPEVHHIERWVDNKALRFDITNGVTLCFDCHNARHNYDGTAFSAEDTFDIYTSLIYQYIKTTPKGASNEFRRQINYIVAILKKRASSYGIIKSIPILPVSLKTILRKKNSKS